MSLFRWFETRIEPTALRPGEPPAGLWAFYWHHVRQVRHLIVALFVAGSVLALFDTAIPVFIGRLVRFASSHAPGGFFREAWPELAGMAAVLLILRPAAFALHYLVAYQAINPGFTNLVRWQNHWHVVRQSWTFFQNDFAGRIANRVMQTGPSLRESVVMATHAIWYIVVYGTMAVVLLASLDLRLAVPVLLWFAGYIVTLRYFV